jgi:uncharacterized protein (TIGR02677 family)
VDDRIGTSDDTKDEPRAQRSVGDLFRYVVEKNAPIYRAIVDVFADAKSRYRIQLRVDEIGRELHVRSTIFGDETDLTRHLDALHTWGNLKRTQDIRDVATVEDFYRRRSLYQFTPEGEEAHKGVLGVEGLFSASGGRLSSVMLPAIAERIEAVCAEMESDADEARLYTLLKELHGYSTELAENARRFMNDIADSLTTLTLTDAAFLAYKRAVIVYLQGFIAELNRYQPRIVDAIRRLDEVGTDLMVTRAASADEAPSTDGTKSGPVRELRERWEALRAWFSGSQHRRPEVDHLRDAMLDAIGRILRILDRLNEKRFLKVNRAADLLRLARWFAEATTDRCEALFVGAFGLHSARHFALASPDEALDRGKSWWASQAVAVSQRLREAGRRSNPGRAASIANYSERKRDGLAEIRAAELRNAEALKRYVDSPVRLSELGHLSPAEFDVLLALLDAAVSTPARPDGVREGTALGQYTVTLAPSETASLAVIETDRGRLTAPDFTLSVRARAAAIRDARRVS